MARFFYVTSLLSMLEGQMKHFDVHMINLIIILIENTMS